MYCIKKSEMVNIPILKFVFEKMKKKKTTFTWTWSNTQTRKGIDSHWLQLGILDQTPTIGELFFNFY